MTRRSGGRPCLFPPGAGALSRVESSWPARSRPGGTGGRHMSVLLGISLAAVTDLFVVAPKSRSRSGGWSARSAVQGSGAPPSSAGQSENSTRPGVWRRRGNEVKNVMMILTASRYSRSGCRRRRTTRLLLTTWKRRSNSPTDHRGLLNTRPDRDPMSRRRILNAIERSDEAGKHDSRKRTTLVSTWSGPAEARTGRIQAAEGFVNLGTNASTHRAGRRDRITSRSRNGARARVGHRMDDRFRPANACVVGSKMRDQDTRNTREDLRPILFYQADRPRNRARALGLATDRRNARRCHRRRQPGDGRRPRHRYFES